MRLISACSVEKAGESKNSNADRFLFDEGFVAIADGVSQSHRPGNWAERLVEILAGRIGVTLTEDLLGQLINDSHSVVEDATTSGVAKAWYSNKLSEIGGQSTALWCELETKRKRRPRFSKKLSLAFYSVGDCAVFILSEDGNVETCWPFPLESVYPDANGAIAEKPPHFRGAMQSMRIKLTRGSLLLFVTDALGRYLYASVKESESERYDRIRSLVEVAMTQDAPEDFFHRWVGMARDISLEDDDTTYMLVRV